ncbi:MAG: nucleotide exchange factor GrpE [Patescibacteria group bacterium]|nr:nucleotide exchange factor GrpE [Patescibacteria group bacterium]
MNDAVSTDEFQQKIIDLEKEVADLTNKWKRAVADYQNLEKRTAKEKEDWAKFSNRLLLARLLTVLDHLELARAHSNDRGLGIIIDDFKSILTGEGLEEIQVKAGDSFDPNFQECVEVVAGSEDSKVVEVVAKGYIIGEKVLRPAKVKVSKVA